MQTIRQNVHNWLGQAFGLTAVIQLLILRATWNSRNSRLLLHTTGKVRRFCLVHFHKKRVQRQLKARSGACKRCGVCCNLLYTCPLLTRQGSCLSYGSCRPQSCKIFPIDQRDIDEVRIRGGQCGFRFDHGRS